MSGTLMLGHGNSWLFKRHKRTSRYRSLEGASSSHDHHHHYHHHHHHHSLTHSVSHSLAGLGDFNFGCAIVRRPLITGLDHCQGCVCGGGAPGGGMTGCGSASARCCRRHRFVRVRRRRQSYVLRLEMNSNPLLVLQLRPSWPSV